MPEIAEVARCVHFLRRHLLGKKIAKVSAPDDANVFGKVKCSGPAFEEAVTGRTVTSVGSQGKYFWITFDRPPHAVMHLGMSGWVHIKGDKTAYTNYYKNAKDSEADAWPPKHWRFLLSTNDSPAVEAAFTDPRRFGRVRLVDCPAESIRSHSPLKENGPDPVVDADVFTEEYLAERMLARRTPVKAFLLDQTNVSGIGNWVADEVLFQARLHPGQQVNDLTPAQVTRLYECVRDVCGTAVEVLGDSDRFPDDWLFNHRWGKKTSKKGGAPTLPSGEELAFVTVAGRTSCIAPALQKKTGQAALAEAEVEAPPVEPESPPGRIRRFRRVTNSSEDEQSEEEGQASKSKRAKGKGKRKQADDDRTTRGGKRPRVEKDDKSAGGGSPGLLRAVNSQPGRPGRVSRLRRIRNSSEEDLSQGEFRAKRKAREEAKTRGS
ncbi:Formamidopyrimidine-DNA glycosylase [Colletotrichum musicola]|uniref:Formamidopyrimidine-DNA glycosylase n=1 Tax=Colletotrichum musicola TaxID=2175873 RepID=A0A8H6NUT1_9PEZI|nr:Formamidopyrimidine-DNA glycosylase [Colletotrichum musicola]